MTPCNNVVKKPRLTLLGIVHKLRPVSVMRDFWVLVLRLNLFHLLIVQDRLKDFLTNVCKVSLGDISFSQAITFEEFLLQLQGKKKELQNSAILTKIR